MKRFLALGSVLALVLSITVSSTFAAEQLRDRQRQQDRSCQDCQCDRTCSDADCPQNCIQQQDRDRDHWAEEEEPGWGLSHMWKWMRQLFLGWE